MRGKSFNRTRRHGGIGGRDVEGYYTNRYGRKVPNLILAWNEVGTAERFHRKTMQGNFKTKRIVNGQVRYYYRKRKREPTYSTGRVKSHLVLLKSKNYDGKSCADDLQTSVLNQINKHVKKYGCK